MKKRVILVALACLVPLAGCVAPYPYYRYGYYDRYSPYGYYGYGNRYGYRDYGEAHRYAPYGDYGYYD